ISVISSMVISSLRRTTNSCPISPRYCTKLYVKESKLSIIKIMTRVVYLRRMDFAEKIGRREKYFWRRPKKNTQGDKPMKPHYAFLQLQFQSGNQVDANFRKKIEGTIANY